MIDLDTLKSALEYNSDTGDFIWISPTGYRVKPGQKAGCIRPVGYVYVCIGGKCYLGHRLAWFYQTGSWPDCHIDHVNGVRSDNRWANIRSATRAENQRNRGRPANNTSGYKGVSWYARKQKWRARLVCEGVESHLGYFDNIEDARSAYSKAASTLHGEFARVA